jgi:hypothetical protein
LSLGSVRRGILGCDLRIERKNPAMKRLVPC